jgi:hypothetical protein
VALVAPLETLGDDGVEDDELFMVACGLSTGLFVLLLLVEPPASEKRISKGGWLLLDWK